MQWLALLHSRKWLGSDPLGLYVWCLHALPVPEWAAAHN